MTQTPVKYLQDKFPEPLQRDTRQAIEKLDKMVVFYESKIPIAPKKQAEMFKGYVRALNYARTTINQYERLTEKLHKIPEDVDND